MAQNLLWLWSNRFMGDQIFNTEKEFCVQPLESR